MVTNYTKTDNFSLNLYGDNDPADLRDGYNGSMRTIDDTLEKHLNRIETLEATDTHDAEVLKALGADSVDNATTAKAKWDQAATDATTAITDATTNNGLLAALGADTTDHAATAKTKWDKAATDASTALANTTNNNVILTALGADTSSHASTLAAKWNGYDGRFNNYTPLHDYAKPIAVFGDSIAFGTGTTTPETDAWPRRFASLIGATEVQMYATNNAGFTVAGTDKKNVLQQIQSFPTATRNQVGTVVISAGINDFNASSSDLVAAMDNAINEAITDFPNAHIIVVPGLCGNNPRISHAARDMMIACGLLSQGYAPNDKISIIPYAWEINAFNTDYYASDNIHLTTNGAKHTARAVADYVFHYIVTRANTPTKSVTLGPGITASENDMTLSCVHGIVQLTGHITLSTKLTAFTRFLNFPQGFEYMRIVPGMVATTGASVFYNAGYSNTVDSFADIASGSTVYANASWTYGN